MPAVQRALQQQVLLLQTARLEVLPDLQPQLVHAERLGEVVERAEAHRLHRGVRRRERRHHERDDLGVDLLGGAQHVDAAHVGHPDVRQQQVERLGLEPRDRLAPVLREHDVVAVAPQHDPQHLAHRRFVVNDEDARLRRPLSLPRSTPSRSRPLDRLK